MTQDRLNSVIDDFYRQRITITRQHLAKIYNLQDCPSDDLDVERIVASKSLPKCFSDFSSWKIDISCLIGSGSLIVIVPVRYPDNFPRIYLDSELLKSVYPVPHIDKHGFICTRDPAVVVINDDKPGEALEELIQIALKIIDSGLKKENVEEYFDELIAYWDENTTSFILSHISNLSTVNILPIYSLDGQLLNSDNIVSDLDLPSFTPWLRQFGISIKDKLKNRLLLMPVTHELPLNLTTFKEAYDYMMRAAHKEAIGKIEEYYSLHQDFYTVLCSMPSKEGYMVFGWFHMGWHTIKINGFRSGHVPFKIILSNSIFCQKKIKKMKVVRLDTERLNARIL